MIVRIFKKFTPMLGAALFGFLVAAGPVAANEPGDVVESFHQTLIDVMKHAGELKTGGRYERLTTPISDTFNLAFMIQAATGGKWKSASDDQKTKLVDAFKRLSVGTYAQRFDGFAGERFETLNELDGPSGSKLVLTQIVRPNKESVPLTYVMRKFGDDWRIVYVIVSGGISELAVRRSEYNAILNDGGPAELIIKLNQKADAILATKFAD